MVWPIAAMAPTNVASGLLSGKPHFLDWGVIQISLANFLIIVLMVLVFVLALVVPFPHSSVDKQENERSNGQP
jgi:large-conductance mechanosensitive channel